MLVWELWMVGEKFEGIFLIIYGYIYIVKNFLVDFWRGINGKYEKWDNMFEKVDRDVSINDIFFNIFV